MILPLPWYINYMNMIFLILLHQETYAYRQTIVVVARMTQRHIRTGRPLVTVVAVVARVTDISLVAVVAVVARET